MKKEIKNILISNIYSWKNKGDAAIVISMLDDIKKQFPNAKITLSTFDKDDVNVYGNYEYRLNTKLYVHKTNERKISLMSKIIFFIIRVKIFEICLKLGYKPYFLFSSSLAAKIREYNDFDLVIACGGGYLLTRTNGGIFLLMVSAHDFYFAKLFNKPYILYNQSIGPFYKKWQYNLIKPFLENAKKLILREDISFKRLKEYNLSNIILSSDIAFNLRIKNNDILKRYSFSKNSINIGLTVRHWLSEDKQIIYEKQLAEFIQTIVSEEEKAYFYFVPQVIFENIGDNDLVTSRKIYDLLPEEYRSRVIIIDLDLHPEELKYIISQMSYFIGTRMHSNIFALSSLTKTIAISYEPKTDGIMRMLDLSDYVIQMDDLDKEKLYKLFLMIKEDSEYLKKLSERIKYARSNSINNLVDLIEH